MINLSVARVLRPYRDFEHDYGSTALVTPVPGSYPIAFSLPVNPGEISVAGGVFDSYAYDEQSREGVPGYSPTLCSMVDAPIGSSCLFYIPVVTSLHASASQWCYVWRIMWRLRNMGDYRRKAKPFSIPKESYGAPDTRSGTPQNRVVIPAASDTTVYVRREPENTTATSMLGIQYAYPEGVAVHAGTSGGYIPGGMNEGFPLQPGAFGDLTKCVDLQQGLIDPINGGIVANLIVPPHIPIWSKASGNELAVWCYKMQYKDPTDPVPLVPRDWDFQWNDVTRTCNPTAEDAMFSVMFGRGYGTPYFDMGVRILHGELGQ